MWLTKRRVSLLRREPQYKIVFQNATTHLAVDQKRKPSEHFPFRKFRGAVQDRPNAVREMGIVRHDSSD
jgi:hypothetical protein